MHVKNPDLEQTSNILKAMSHPDRLAIVAGVIKNECNKTKLCHLDRNLSSEAFAKDGQSEVER